MPRRSHISGLVRSTLAHLLSRNADMDGYWIRGLIINDHDTFTINLLDIQKKSDGKDDASYFCRLQEYCCSFFATQLKKHTIPLSNIEQATITLHRRGIISEKFHYPPHTLSGYQTSFILSARSDRGKLYEIQQTCIVCSVSDFSFMQRSGYSEIKKGKSSFPHKGRWEKYFDMWFSWFKSPRN